MLFRSTPTSATFALGVEMLAWRTSSGVADNAVAVLGVPLLVRVYWLHVNLVVPGTMVADRSPHTFCAVAAVSSHGAGVAGGLPGLPT